MQQGCSFLWPEFLYHYTNKAGADGILRTGWLMKSESQEWDARLGEGVYLTHLRPREGRSAILLNNYGKTTNGQGIDKDKADWCFKFKTCQLYGVYDRDLNGRIVWRYPGSIFMRDFWYSFGRTEDDESCFIVHQNPHPFPEPVYHNFNNPPMFELQNMSPPPHWVPFRDNVPMQLPPRPFHNPPLVWRDVSNYQQQQRPPPNDVPFEWRGPVDCRPWPDRHSPSQHEQFHGDTHGDYSQYRLPQCHLNDDSPGPWGQNEYYLHPQPQPALNDAPWIQNELSFGGEVPFSPNEVLLPPPADYTPQWNPKRSSLEDGHHPPATWQNRRQTPYQRPRDNPQSHRDYLPPVGIVQGRNNRNEATSRVNRPIRPPMQNANIYLHKESAFVKDPHRGINHRNLVVCNGRRPAM